MTSDATPEEGQTPLNSPHEDKTRSILSVFDHNPRESMTELGEAAFKPLVEDSELFEQFLSKR